MPAADHVLLEDDLDYKKRRQKPFNPFDIPQQDLLTPINPQLQRFPGLNSQALAAATPPPPPITPNTAEAPEQKPIKMPPISGPPPVPVPAAPPPVQTPLPAQTPPANASGSQIPSVAPPAGALQRSVRLFNEEGERLPPGEITRQLRQSGVPHDQAYKIAYALHEGASGNIMPMPPPQPPQPRQEREELVPMSDLDYARAVRAMEKLGYHPMAARLLAPTFWQVVKKRTPVDPTTMMLFQPQLPTHVRTRRWEVSLQPPGMQEAALQEWQRQQAAQEHAAEFHRRLLEAQQQLAQQQLQADVLLRQERARQAAGTTQKAIEGLQSHPTVVPPTAPYGALGQLEQYAAPQNTKQREYLQAVIAQIQSDQSFTEEQKQKLMSWLASIL